MNTPRNIILSAIALPVLLGTLACCQKDPQPQKGSIAMSSSYVGESARGLEFRLSVADAKPGTYDLRVKDVTGVEVFASQVAVLASSSFDVAIPQTAFSKGSTVTCAVESDTHRGETTLADGRDAEGESAVVFREGDALLLEMGHPHVIAPVFFPSIKRVASRSPQWYLTTGCAAMQVSADGLSAKIGGLKEGSVEVGMYLDGGKRGLKTRVIIPVDPAFSASLSRGNYFSGQAVSLSLKREKAADPQASYRVALSVDAQAVPGISPEPQEHYDITPEKVTLRPGEHIATLQVSVGDEVQYEYLLPFTVHPTPDPTFISDGAGATHGYVVLPHGKRAGIRMSTPGLVPDGYSLDFSASADLVTAETTDGRTVTAKSRGEGTFRLTVHKGDGEWTSEPLPVLSYGVIDVSPLLVSDGFKVSAVQGGFKVGSHNYGDGLVLNTLTVENIYTVTYSGGKTVALEGAKKTFTNVSLESGHENRWSLADDAQALLDALGRAGATEASLEALTVEQTLTFSLSDKVLTLSCGENRDASINTTIRTRTVCTSLDERIPIE